MPPTKPALRAAMLARLRALSPDERRERSARLLTGLLERETWRQARVVALFAPLRSEPDLDPIWTRPGALTGKTVLYPRVEPGGLVLRVVNVPDELLVPGPAGSRLREPSATAPEFHGWPDVMLVPGLAFTSAGGRLGRGGGHYDRLLARPGRSACQVWGVGFAFQGVPDLPQKPHDAVLDGFVTDSLRGL